MYNKRIVVDLDDTICKTKKRDFENATPITPVIEKINYFYNLGFEIIIQTARGQISCNGDYKKADKKYRKQVENWLDSNKVKYHELTFNKVLAQFYIDDKALSPSLFSALETNEMSGRSGDFIIRAGNYVYKTTKKAKDELNWYAISGANFSSYKTPKINSLVGDTICMDYINDIKENKFYSILPHLKKTINEYKSSRIGSKDWRGYVSRVKKHIEKNNLPSNILKKLINIEKIMVAESSFSHGDLTLENIIYDGSFYLIDSIFNKQLYSSYLIDISKMLYSLKSNNMIEEYNYLMYYYIEENDFDAYFLTLLESTHWIRVYSYLKDDYEKEIYLKQITEYDELFK